MNTRSEKPGVFLILVATLVVAGCGVSKQRIGPSHASVSHHGVQKGDTVLVRYANENDRRSSSNNELIQLTAIDKDGLSGVRENGDTVNISYEEIFEIERRRVGFKLDAHDTAMVGAGKAVAATGKIVGTVLQAMMGAQ